MFFIIIQQRSLLTSPLRHTTTLSSHVIVTPYHTKTLSFLTSPICHITTLSSHVTITPYSDALYSRHHYTLTGRKTPTYLLTPYNDALFSRHHYVIQRRSLLTSPLRHTTTSPLRRTTTLSSHANQQVVWCRIETSVKCSTSAC